MNQFGAIATALLFFSSAKAADLPEVSILRSFVEARAARPSAGASEMLGGPKSVSCNLLGLRQRPWQLAQIMAPTSAVESAEEPEAAFQGLLPGTRIARTWPAASSS